MNIYYTFPQGKTKVLTLSYDDGRKADRRLVEIFNQYGIRATFNINGDLLGKPDRIEKNEVSTLYHGHEIATHAYTHPMITRCPMVQLTREIMEDRKVLEKLTGGIIRGHAYPFGVYNEEIKDLFSKLGIVYARTTRSTEKFDLPLDWMEWNATCHHNQNLMKHAKNFVDSKKSRYLKCMYVWGHSYEFDEQNNWELIEDFCQYISDRKDIWYATNIEIRDYIEACKNLQFSTNQSTIYNPNAISIWLNVNDEIVEVAAGKMITCSE